MLVGQKLEQFLVVKKIDPTITEEEFGSFDYFNLTKWFYDDPKIIRAILKGARDRAYRKQNLERYDRKVSFTSTCYSTGTEKWRRKDGNPLNEKDLQNLKNLSYGGGEVISSGQKGDYFSIVRWEYDSTD